MVLILRLVLVAAVFLTSNSHLNGSVTTPRFEDYPATIEVVAKHAVPRITDARSRKYSAQLREASRNAPDFAGHYVLAGWGCGASCVMIAAIDAKTGEVTNFPFTISNWPLNITEPMSYKPESRLLILQGDLNEKPGGTYFFEFTGHSFNLIRKVQPGSKR